MTDLKPGYVIDPETARLEFERWASGMGLLLDSPDLTSEDLQVLNSSKTQILDALQRGALVINDEDEAVYTPYRKRSTHTDPITFHERTGATLAASGRGKNDAEKGILMMSEICGVPKNTFSKLAGPDIKTCEALFALLMNG